MKELLLTPEQAFSAMCVFLNRYSDRTNGSAELGAVLGDIQISSDGRPFDLAAWSDWLAAINEATEMQQKARSIE